VDDVHGDVAELAEVPVLLVETDELGDGHGVGGADAPRGDVRRERGCGGGVLEERAEEVNILEVEEHAKGGGMLAS